MTIEKNYEFFDNGLPSLDNKKRNTIQSLETSKNLVSFENTFRKFKDIFGMNCTIDKYQSEIREIEKNINNHPTISKINNSLSFPFYLPRIMYEDQGECLEYYLLPKLKEHLGNNFINKNSEELIERCTDTYKTKYDIFLEKNNTEIFGLYFPCIREFTIPESIELINMLPENFVLSGALETISAILCNEESQKLIGNQKKLWMSGITSETSGTGFNLTFENNMISFNREIHGKDLYNNFINGITVFNS